jgi:thiosulfate/3-mercaptopyruvate sulfurtransferase
MDDLVSTAWLAKTLGQRDLTIIDSSWFMPALGRNARKEYLSAHIPGARFLDIDEVAHSNSTPPHMLPSAAEFGAAMEKLGVGKDDRIVVYDNSPTRTAARGWFMFRHFGAPKVAILDGGFQKWLAEARPTEKGKPIKKMALFEAVERSGEVVSKRQINSGFGMPMVDARGRARFEGTEADPRPGVAPGHIPGARNLPYSDLYNQDGTLRSPDEIRRLFLAAGVDPEKPFVASCGSGVTANSLIFAARMLGNRDGRLYDGSWSEWGADPKTPKQQGPA